MSSSDWCCTGTHTKFQLPKYSSIPNIYEWSTKALNFSTNWVGRAFRSCTRQNTSVPAVRHKVGTESYSKMLALFHFCTHLISVILLGPHDGELKIKHNGTAFQPKQTKVLQFHCARSVGRTLARLLARCLLRHSHVLHSLYTRLYADGTETKRSYALAFLVWVLHIHIHTYLYLYMKASRLYDDIGMYYIYVLYVRE